MIDNTDTHEIIKKKIVCFPVLKSRFDFWPSAFVQIRRQCFFFTNHVIDIILYYCCYLYSFQLLNNILRGVWVTGIYLFHLLLFNYIYIYIY